MEKQMLGDLKLSKRVNMFFNICMTTILIGSILVEKLEDKIKHNNDSNICLFEIIQVINKFSYLYNLLPDDPNGIIFRKIYNSKLKPNLENKNCFIIDNNNVNCFIFYENNIKKSAVNKELLQKVKKQDGGGLKTIAAATIGFLSMLSILAPQVNAFTTSSDNFVKKEKEMQEPTGLVHEQFLFEHYNQFGTCSLNAYMAEINAGGFLTMDEWKSIDPDAIERIQAAYDPENRLSYNYKYETKNSAYTDYIYNRPGMHIGASVERIYGEKFTKVPSDSAKSPDFYKQHFKDGELTEQAQASRSTSNLAIAAVATCNHAFNLMYNRDNETLCLSDENQKVEYVYNKGFITGTGVQFICEEGFFNEGEISELNAMGNIVIVVPNGTEDENNIFMVAKDYNPNVFSFIRLIRNSEKIFDNDNNGNTGTLKDYVAMHEMLHNSIIEQITQNIDYIKANKKEIDVTDEQISVLVADLNNKKEGLLLEDDGQIPNMDPIFSRSSIYRDWFEEANQKHLETKPELDYSRIYPLAEDNGVNKPQERRVYSEYESVFRPLGNKDTSLTYSPPNYYPYEYISSGKKDSSSIDFPNIYASQYKIGSHNTNNGGMGGKIKNKKHKHTNKKHKHTNKKHKHTNKKHKHTNKKHKHTNKNN